MNERDEQESRPRSRKGEKFIESSVDGPYQFNEQDFSPDAIALTNGEVIVRATIDELIDAMSALVFTEARFSVSQFGDFQLALSDAGQLFPLYERLMCDPNVRGLPWLLTHLWQIENNMQGIVGETIVAHADIPVDQVHAGLPLQCEDESAPRIDCVVVDYKSAIPVDIQIRKIIVVAPSVEACEVFAKTNCDFTVCGFVLQENQ